MPVASRVLIALALVAAGCSDDSVSVGAGAGAHPARVGTASRWIEVLVPVPGALVSSGEHDVVFVLDHSAARSAEDIRRQVDSLEKVTASLADQAEDDDLAFGVVFVGARAHLQTPLTNDPARWDEAVEAAKAVAAEGLAEFADGVDVAVRELSGSAARRAAMPILLHWSGEHEAEVPPGVVELDLREGVDGLGVSVASLLRLAHDPLAVDVRTKRRESVRLRALDPSGEAFLDETGEGRRLEATAAIPASPERQPVAIRAQTLTGEILESVVTIDALPALRDPGVESVTPPIAVPGDEVTVVGRHFSTRPGGNLVQIGELVVAADTENKHGLTFILPEGGSDGTLAVIADGITSAPAVFRIDSDGDGVPNNDEIDAGTDPYVPDVHVPMDCFDGERTPPETGVDCGGPCPPCAAGIECAEDGDCTSDRCREGVCLADHCSSGELDSDESDVDCGGACAPCLEGFQCNAATDCSLGSCLAGRCRPAHCANGIIDASESDPDCGGPCAPCPVGGACVRRGDCETQVCRGGFCEVNGCDDRLRSGAETGVDCGGPDCAPCASGQACAANTDCISGRCDGGTCTPPACDDGVRNGTELNRDCGGPDCPGCAVGMRCEENTDCADLKCEDGVCQPPTCDDGLANGEEADVDCGGACAACDLGAACVDGSDCDSGTCIGAVCVPPECANAALDAGETDVDCGGPSCARCAGGARCAEGADCASTICNNGVCTEATCEDGIRNGQEADVDCGGRCAFCAVGSACRANGDCASRICVGQVCVEPACDDGVDNGLETDVDCGGGCGLCPAGSSCEQDGDCASDDCHEEKCVTPTCVDDRVNQGETDVDCGGENCAPCAVGLGCGAANDCRSGVCNGGVCAAPACDDGIRNGAEPDIDCGGGCDPCPVDGPCRVGRDCAERVCAVIDGVGTCAAARCGDFVRNGAEIDVDCGGGCGPCAAGQACLEDAGCDSQRCTVPNAGEPGRCAAPVCDDGVQNGTETDLDCGGFCRGCAAGLVCAVANDCADGICEGGACAPASCDDGVRNGREADVDCGGACAPCPAGTPCDDGADCDSGRCAATCLEATCDDGLANGGESDVDCGQVCPDRCDVGMACGAPEDCLDGSCGGEPAVCQAPTCDDGVRNGVETDVDCGGGTCAPCALNQGCALPGDCESGLCHRGVCEEDTCQDGVRSGRETDADCGGPCAPCADGGRCLLAADCQTSFCRWRTCEPAPSCAAIHLADPTIPDGIYRLAPPGVEDDVEILCDMSTDGGGWTLVASSPLFPPDDVAMEWTENLTTVLPVGPAPGVWSGMRSAAGDRPADVRFACRGAGSPDAAVDLTFYEVDWYHIMTSGSDADSCFTPRSAPFLDLPARKNNRTGAVRGVGSGWSGGPMYGEATCDDELGFTVDFDDAGLDGDERDGTDWGEDDGLAKCGVEYVPQGAGAWFIWLREDVGRCWDGLRNGDEEGVDCGGACVACPRACAANRECASGVCDGGACAPARCSDGVMNGDETGVDCGGGCGATCPDGSSCAGDDDCDSALCRAGVCVPQSCSNGEFEPEAGETDLDCGGPCPGCALGLRCGADEDCATAACGDRVCIDEPCENGVLDPGHGERDVDCGGERCGPCQGGGACAIDKDCESGRCEAGVCASLAACDGLWNSRAIRGTGVYHLGEGPDTDQVWCDMDADAGGWTLVAASHGAPPSDGVAAYHADLAAAMPLGAHDGIWGGLRPLLAGVTTDLRFTCQFPAAGNVVTQAVDLSFYGVPWYAELTAGDEAASCFNEAEGRGFDRPAPARRDNVSGAIRARGDLWDFEIDGFLEGEDACAAPDDFTVDFDDRGLDGDEADGTDWGLDDGVAKCGVALTPAQAAATTWQVWVRRGQPHCFDGEVSGDERGPDCGGSCPASCP